MASGERGFKGILLSSIFGKCKVSFQCAPQPVIFQTDGNTYFIEIFNGYGRFADIDNYDDYQNDNSEEINSKSSNQVNQLNINSYPSSENLHNTSNLTDTDYSTINHSPNSSMIENNSQDFDQIIHADIHSIEGTDDEILFNKISIIVEHFKVVCMALYDSPVIEINLTFGIENNKIHLIDGNVTTTPNTYASFLFKSIPGGEETFIDYFVSSVLYEPTNNSESQNEFTGDYQYDTDSSFSVNSSSSEKKFKEKNHKNKTKKSTETINNSNSRCCYSNLPNCLEGKYKMPILYVMYYFAKQYFPEVEADKLYTLLKIRLFKTNSDKEVNVCVKCVHLYSDEKRDHQIVKKEKDYLHKKNIPSYEDDHLFILEPRPPEIKITKGRIRLHAKKAPISIRRMMNGKPSHHFNELQSLKETKNNDEWNNFYDNLTKKKSKSTSCMYRRSSQLSIQKHKKANKNVEMPHFSPQDSMALKKAPDVYSNHHLLRNSWETENIVKRFQTKSYSISNPQYIEPKNCRILEMLNYY